jgi:hypothetical protein
MNPSLPTIVNPYAPPDVNDGVSSTRLHKWRPLLSFVAFFLGSMIGLIVGSDISEGFGAAIHKSLVNIPAAIWSFLTWAACWVAFTCPWRIVRRFVFVTSRPIPLAHLIAAIQVSALFYLTGQQLSRSGMLNIVPVRMHSFVFAMLALVFGSAAVECEILLTRLFSRATSNGGDHSNKDSKIALN